MKTIGDWLSQVGMQEYAQRFAENGIDLDPRREQQTPPSAGK